MIAAYRHPDRAAVRAMMNKLIMTVSHGVPTALSEVTTLGFRNLTLQIARRLLEISGFRPRLHPRSR